MARKKSTRPNRAQASGFATPSNAETASLMTSIQQHVEAQRRRLLGADAVIICVQRAMDSRRRVAR